MAKRSPSGNGKHNLHRRKTSGNKDKRQDRITLDKAERTRLDAIISEYEQQNRRKPTCLNEPVKARHA